MKKTVLNKEWMFNKKGEFCGVDLGSDFCSEHECGIDLIKAAFNMDGIVKKHVTKLFGLPVRTTIEPNYGIKSRQIQKLPDTLIKGVASKYRFVGFYDTTFSKWLETLVKNAIKEIRLLRDRDGTQHPAPFMAYWCDRGFLLVSDDQDKMIAIRDAFTAHDIAIFMGGSKFLSNKGLIIAIASKLDKEVIDDFENVDRSRHELSERVEACEIIQRLHKAGKQYYALTPRWKDDTHTEFWFWLNPIDQHTNNYGHFTVEELDQWIKNEGPIPIKNDKK